MKVDLLKNIRDFLLSEGDLLLVTHFNPDGDAIGSMLALGGILDEMNIEYTMAIDDFYPDKYEFMPGIKKIRNLKEEKLEKIFSRVIILDAGSLIRIGDAQENIGAETRILNVDHHMTANLNSEINFLDTSASATSEMIYFLAQMNYGIYVGIITDTGRFRFSNTTAESLTICGEMISNGVSPTIVSENVFYNLTYDSLRALGWGLSRVELVYNGLIAIISLDLEHLVSETESFIEFSSSIETAIIAIFICEIEEDVFKVSIRSKSRINVCDIAKKMGGGGHKQAAGFRYSGSVVSMRKQLLTEIKTEIDKLSLKSNELRRDDFKIQEEITESVAINNFN